MFVEIEVLSGPLIQIPQTKGQSVAAQYRHDNQLTSGERWPALRVLVGSNDSKNVSSNPCPLEPHVKSRSCSFCVIIIIHHLEVNAAFVLDIEARLIVTVAGHGVVLIVITLHGVLVGLSRLVGVSRLLAVHDMHVVSHSMLAGVQGLGLLVNATSDGKCGLLVLALRGRVKVILRQCRQRPSFHFWTHVDNASFDSQRIHQSEGLLRIQYFTVD